jgi:hypothetical protein
MERAGLGGLLIPRALSFASHRLRLTRAAGFRNAIGKEASSGAVLVGARHPMDRLILERPAMPLRLVGGRRLRHYGAMKGSP